MTRAYLLAALALAAPVRSLAAEAPRTLTAHGQAVVTGGDVRTARARALRDLLRNAVAEVVAQLGGPAEGADPEVDRAVYARAATLVQRTDVVTENVDLNILGVDARVVVDTAAVRGALGDRAGRAAVPRGHAGHAAGGRRVLILATEQLGPHRIVGWTDYAFGWDHASARTTAYQITTDMGGIEAAFADVLGSGGFEVIDPHVLHGRLAPRSAVSVLELAPTEARAIASKADADYVLVAKGVAKDAYHATVAAGGMVSGQGNVVARLVRMSDGKVVASSTQHAAAVHIDPDTARLNAIDEAARLCGRALLDRANAD